MANVTPIPAPFLPISYRVSVLELAIFGKKRFDLGYFSVIYSSMATNDVDVYNLQ